MRARRSLFLFASVVVALTCAATQPLQADVTTNIREPLAMDVFVPCAAGGAGEVVSLTGTLHLLIRATTDNTGGVHVGVHSQPVGVSGVGQTTGDTYRGTGVTQDEFNGRVDVGAEDTFVNNFRVIGQGPGNNFTVHQTIHITITANGDVGAVVDNTKISCS